MAMARDLPPCPKAPVLRPRPVEELPPYLLLEDLADEEKQRPRSFSGATTVSATGSERSSGILTPRFFATLPRAVPIC